MGMGVAVLVSAHANDGRTHRSAPTRQINSTRVLANAPNNNHTRIKKPEGLRPPVLLLLC